MIYGFDDDNVKHKINTETGTVIEKNNLGWIWTKDATNSGASHNTLLGTLEGIPAGKYMVFYNAYISKPSSVYDELRLGLRGANTTSVVYVYLNSSATMGIGGGAVSIETVSSDGEIPVNADVYSATGKGFTVKVQSVVLVRIG